MEKLIEFLDARDQLVGFGNYTGRQDLIEGLKRLKKCDNDEALWCCNILDESVTEREQAYELFSKMLENNILPTEKARVLVYAGLIGHSYVIDYINQAANLGNALALGMQVASWSMGDQEMFEKARRSADLNDRYGLYQLSLFYFRNGFKYNEALALSILRRAADLESALAMEAYGTRAFSDYDLERYLWYERAAQKNHTDHFFSKIFVLVNRMEALISSPTYELEILFPVIFTIGQIFKRNTDPLTSHIFGRYYLPKESLVTIKVYETFSEMARNATYTWLIIAKRVTPFLYKDVAQLIARYIWNQRINWNSKLTFDFFDTP